MGDDGVGIHVVHELKRRRLPDHVDVVDGGTAGVDLIDILSSYRKVLVIDAIRGQGDTSSGIRSFSSDDLIWKWGGGNYSIHDMELSTTLRLMKNLNMDIPDITILGIPVVNVTPGLGLSEKCSGFVPEAVDLIVTISQKMLRRTIARGESRSNLNKSRSSSAYKRREGGGLRGGKWP